MRLQDGGGSAISTCSSEQRLGLHISDQGRRGQTQRNVRWGPLSSQLLPAAYRKTPRIDHNVLGIWGTAWGPQAWVEGDGPSCCLRLLAEGNWEPESSGHC